MARARLQTASRQGCILADCLASQTRELEHACADRLPEPRRASPATACDEQRASFAPTRAPIARRGALPARRASSSRFRPRPSTASAPTPATPTPCAGSSPPRAGPPTIRVIVHLADLRGRAATGRATCPRRRARAGRSVLARAADADPAARRARARRRHRRPGQRRACACRRIRSRARCSQRIRRRHRRAVGQSLRPRVADDGARTSPTISATRSR